MTKVYEPLGAVSKLTGIRYAKKHPIIYEGFTFYELYKKKEPMIVLFNKGAYFIVAYHCEKERFLKSVKKIIDLKDSINKYLEGFSCPYEEVGFLTKEQIENFKII